MASTRLGPLYHPASASSELLVVRFSPVRPLQGRKVRSDSRKPACRVRKGLSLAWIASNLSSLHSTVSSLLTATTSWLTPRLLTSSACSLVCPPASKPASNSPVVAFTTSTPTSAW